MTNPREQLDHLISSWGSGVPLGLGRLADEAAAIRGRSGIQRRRPASAGAALALRGGRSALPTSDSSSSGSGSGGGGGGSTVPPRPSSAHDSSYQAEDGGDAIFRAPPLQAPTLRIPEQILQLLKARAIRKVALISQGLRPTDAEVLGNFIERDRVVTELDLSGNLLGAEGAAHIARALVGTPLRTLSLKGVDLCHSAWAAQTHVFSSLALEELMDCLPESSVTHLDLSDNFLAGKEVHGGTTSPVRTSAILAVARALASPAGCPLLSLVLSGNRLGVAGAALLGEALQRRSWLLQVLDISYCTVLGLAKEQGPSHMADGLRQICDALKTNYSLRALHLDGNELGSGSDTFSGRGVAVAVLEKCFLASTMPSLEELTLNDNGLTYADDCRLALSLVHNTTCALRVLDVSVHARGTRSFISDADTHLSVHYIESLATRDPGGGGQSTPLHWACRQRSAACAAIILWRHPKMLLAVDGYGDTALDVARTVNCEPCIAMLQRAIEHRLAYRSRYLSSGNTGRQDQASWRESAIDVTTGKRCRLKFFTTDERSRWKHECDILRAIAAANEGNPTGQQASPSDRLVANLVDCFYDSSRAEQGLPPFVLVCEQGIESLLELQKSRKQDISSLESERWHEHGRAVSLAAIATPAAMKFHAATLLPVVQFARAEVAHIACCLCENLDFLHNQCRLVHGAFDANNIMRFPDGTWRTTSHSRAVPFGSSIYAATGASTCPPELAARLLSSHGDEHLLASSSYDLWAFGVIIFQLLTGRPLVASIETPYGTSAGQSAVHRQLIALDVSSRLLEVADEAGRDFVSLLLGVGGKPRESAAAMLGRGSGRTEKHQFLCPPTAEPAGWLSTETSAVSSTADGSAAHWITVPQVHEAVQADGRSTVHFEVKVCLPNRPERTVLRKFAEFKFLLRTLMELEATAVHRTHAFFGWMPTALESGTRSQSAATLERRRVGLQEFLQTSAHISIACAQRLLQWIEHRGTAEVCRNTTSSGPKGTGKDTAVKLASDMIKKPGTSARLGGVAVSAEAAANLGATVATNTRREELQSTLPISFASKQSTGAEQVHVFTAFRPASASERVRERIRNDITQIYAQHNPEKVADISDIMDEWAGEELALLRAVREKYLSGSAPNALDSALEATRVLQAGVKDIKDRAKPLASQLKPAASKLEEIRTLGLATAQIAEVLQAQSRRAAADAALPGLNPASHSSDIIDDTFALRELANLIKNGQSQETHKLIPVVTFARGNAIMCRLLWSLGGCLGFHWLYMRHINNRIQPYNKVASSLPNQSVGFTAIDESATSARLSFPFVRRTFMSWALCACGVGLYLLLTKVVPVTSCEDNFSHALNGTVRIELDSKPSSAHHVFIDVNCLWRRQTTAYKAAYFAFVFTVALAIVSWMFDGFWLSEVTRQLRSRNTERVTICCNWDHRISSVVALSSAFFTVALLCVFIDREG